MYAVQIWFTHSTVSGRSTGYLLSAMLMEDYDCDIRTLHWPAHHPLSSLGSSSSSSSMHTAKARLGNDHGDLGHYAFEANDTAKVMYLHPDDPVIRVQQNNRFDFQYFTIVPVEANGWALQGTRMYRHRCMCVCVYVCVYIHTGYIQS